MPESPNTEEIAKTSSQPSEQPGEQAELFRDVLNALESCRIPYAISGAFSLRQHTGICRYTKDLDLFLTAKNSSLALDCLREIGLECEVTDPVWLSKAWRDGYFVDLITGMSNGMITVEESWIERARPAVVHGVKTRVLAPEELVASKIFVAKRERFDGADIAHVIYGTYGDFDWEREMELAGEHWEMLLWSLVMFRYVYPAQSHYVPSEIWCELVTRFSHEVKNPNAEARFRGSLIDENMFAIDVDEWELPDLLEESRKTRLARLGQDQAPCDSLNGMRKKA
ncbi:MAG: nucleotidyltransferase [Candidatus Sulfotelmatobacter sp.]